MYFLCLYVFIFSPDCLCCVTVKALYRICDFYFIYYLYYLLIFIYCLLLVYRFMIYLFIYSFVCVNPFVDDIFVAFITNNLISKKIVQILQCGNWKYCY